MNYTSNDRLADFYWFLEHYSEFYEQYGVCHVVIQHKHILGIYKDFSSALEETQKNHVLGTFCIQFCNGDESGYTNYFVSPNLII